MTKVKTTTSSPKAKKASAAKTSAKAPKKTKATSKNELLGVIAQLAPLHGGKPPRELVARRAGYGNADNGSFKKALSRASKKGTVDLSEKTLVALTDQGKELAGDAPEVETNEQAQEVIKNELTGKMKEVFEILKDGKVHLRTDIAAELEYDSEKNEGFKKLLARIRLKGFLENIDKESVQLSDICFPNGRDED